VQPSLLRPPDLDVSLGYELSKRLRFVGVLTEDGFAHGTGIEARPRFYHQR